MLDFASHKLKAPRVGYDTDGRQMHFIFDLIHEIIRGKEYGEPVVLWGDGCQKRELVLVDEYPVDKFNTIPVAI